MPRQLRAGRSCVERLGLPSGVRTLTRAAYRPSHPVWRGEVAPHSTMNYNVGVFITQLRSLTI